VLLIYFHQFQTIFNSLASYIIDGLISGLRGDIGQHHYVLLYYTNNIHRAVTLNQ